MKNKQAGFLMQILIVIIAIAFLRFYKTADGTTYYEKIYYKYILKKEDLQKKVDDTKKTLEDHDKEIESYLE